MPVPQFLLDLLAVLYALSIPAATLTLVAAGLSLREGGLNFHINGKTGKWMVWTAILLTVPQILQWIGTQGVNIPSDPGNIQEAWIAGSLNTFKNFVALILNSFVPVAAAFLVLKATLDGAAGDNPLPSVIGAIFLLSIPTTLALLQGWNDGTDTATTNILQQFWNYIADRIMPAAGGLAVVGCVLNFVQKKPYARLVFAALGFFCLTGLFKLIQAMAA